MPDTVNGYLLQWKVSTPCPPPTPIMNPPLVNTTATAPVSARLGVARPIDAEHPSAAASINPIPYFFIIISFFKFEPGPPWHGLQLRGLLRQDHGKVAKHSKQDAGYGVGNRESNPRHTAVDFDRGFATRTGMRSRAGHAAHEYGRVYFEQVIAESPNDEGGNRAGD